MAERDTGFEASVCITPESISPDSASTGSSAASSTDRKFAAYNPRTQNITRFTCRVRNGGGFCAMSRAARMTAVENTSRKIAPHIAAAARILRRRAS
jgi:hypothetical protein